MWLQQPQLQQPPLQQQLPQQPQHQQPPQLLQLPQQQQLQRQLQLHNAVVVIVVRLLLYSCSDYLYFIV